MRKGINVSRESEEAWLKFNKWYKQHRTTSRDVKQEFIFMQKALDETLYLLAHLHRDIRSVENKKREGLILTPGMMGPGV